jgi:hypothetical protein
MASLLASDTASARGAVADILGLALQTLGALGFGYAIAIYCDWRMALLVTGLLPVLVSGAVIQTRYVATSAAAANCLCTHQSGVRRPLPESSVALVDTSYTTSLTTRRRRLLVA